MNAERHSAAEPWHDAILLLMDRGVYRLDEDLDVAETVTEYWKACDCEWLWVLHSSWANYYLPEVLSAC